MLKVNHKTPVFPLIFCEKPHNVICPRSSTKIYCVFCSGNNAHTRCSKFAKEVFWSNSRRNVSGHFRRFVVLILYWSMFPYQLNTSSGDVLRNSLDGMGVVRL
jgi:hypothetical protein